MNLAFYPLPLLWYEKPRTRVECGNRFEKEKELGGPKFHFPEIIWSYLKNCIQIKMRGFLITMSTGYDSIGKIFQLPIVLTGGTPCTTNFELLKLSHDRQNHFGSTAEHSQSLKYKFVKAPAAANQCSFLK